VFPREDSKNNDLFLYWKSCNTVGNDRIGEFYDKIAQLMEPSFADKVTHLKGNFRLVLS
jgi:hypothetical protein